MQTASICSSADPYRNKQASYYNSLEFLVLLLFAFPVVTSSDQALLLDLRRLSDP